MNNDNSSNNPINSNLQDVHRDILNQVDSNQNDEHSDWSVVLHNAAGQVVLFNSSTNSTRIQFQDSARCRYCGSMLPSTSAAPHPEYFKLLESTLNETFIQYQPLNKSNLNQGYYSTFFIQQQKLGRGYRGSVFKCVHVLNGESLGEFAVKKIPVGNAATFLSMQLQEVKLLEKLRHAHIIEYKHCWIEDSTDSLFSPSVPTLFILMEWANGGNLEEWMVPDHIIHTVPGQYPNAAWYSYSYVAYLAELVLIKPESLELDF